jgi:hypothetical protein
LPQNFATDGIRALLLVFIVQLMVYADGRPAAGAIVCTQSALGLSPVSACSKTLITADRLSICHPFHGTDLARNAGSGLTNNFFFFLFFSLLLFLSGIDSLERINELPGWHLVPLAALTL